IDEGKEKAGIACQGRRLDGGPALPQPVGRFGADLGQIGDTPDPRSRIGIGVESEVAVAVGVALQFVHEAGIQSAVEADVNGNISDVGNGALEEVLQVEMPFVGELGLCLSKAWLEAEVGAGGLFESAEGVSGSALNAEGSRGIARVGRMGISRILDAD